MPPSWTAQQLRDYENHRLSSRAKPEQVVAPIKKPAMKKRNPSYNPKVVTAFFNECGIPTPQYEFEFHPTRKWRMDLAWPSVDPSTGEQGGVYVEVNGGIWIAGGHSRGAGMLKDWEKWNAATVMGYRPLFCQPADLCTNAFAETIKRALGL